VSQYVVCPKCGTRIKAGRAHCLRCLADLPSPDQPIIPPIWESLGLSQQQKVAVAAVATVLVVALVALMWQMAPEYVDTEARPAAAQEVLSPRPAAQPPQPAAEPTPVAPAVVQASVSTTTTTPAVVDGNRTGAVEYARGNFEGARAAYEQALASKPDDAETLNNLGQVLVRLNRANDAIPRFERAIELVPEKAVFHFNLGFAAAQLNRWDRAVSEYREAMKLFPTDYATQYNLAMALHKKGDEKAAIPEFEKAIALAPGEPSFHLSLGMSLERVGRTADAVREYRTYLEMDPSSADAGRLKEHVASLSARGEGKSGSASP